MQSLFRRAARDSAARSRQSQWKRRAVKLSYPGIFFGTTKKHFNDLTRHNTALSSTPSTARYSMPVATFPIGPLGTNSYILSKDKHALAIDVGGDPQDILFYLQSQDARLEAICITHLHFDHIYGVARLAKTTGAKVYAPDGDAVLADTEASRGGIWGMPLVEPFSSEKLPIGETQFAEMPCTVLETPGHTPGSVSLYFPTEGIVFTGDALFYHSVGRTDFPLGDSDTLFSSIRAKLFSLPETTRVYPGHGPETSIREEKQNNPFCGEFAV